MKLAYKEDPLPKYIAVEGPIGVGKTTLANKLEKLPWQISLQNLLTMTFCLKCQLKTPF